MLSSESGSDEARYTHLTAWVTEEEDRYVVQVRLHHEMKPANAAWGEDVSRLDRDRVRPSPCSGGEVLDSPVAHRHTPATGKPAGRDEALSSCDGRRRSPRYGDPGALNVPATRLGAAAARIKSGSKLQRRPASREMCACAQNCRRSFRCDEATTRRAKEVDGEAQRRSKRRSLRQLQRQRAGGAQRVELLRGGGAGAHLAMRPLR